MALALCETTGIEFQRRVEVERMKFVDDLINIRVREIGEGDLKRRKEKVKEQIPVGY